MTICCLLSFMFCMKLNLPDLFSFSINNTTGMAIEMLTENWRRCCQLAALYQNNDLHFLKFSLNQVVYSPLVIVTRTGCKRSLLVHLGTSHCSWNLEMSSWHTVDMYTLPVLTQNIPSNGLFYVSFYTFGNQAVFFSLFLYEDKLCLWFSLGPEVWWWRLINPFRA